MFYLLGLPNVPKQCRSAGFFAGLDFIGKAGGDRSLPVGIREDVQVVKIDFLDEFPGIFEPLPCLAGETDYQIGSECDVRYGC